MVTVKPLFSEMKANSTEIQNFSSQINALKVQLERPQTRKVRGELQSILDDVSLKEADCFNKRKELISKFDECIGLEHFMREISQLFETYEISHVRGVHKDINYESLPSVAARLLLSGWPIEILDGDSNFVPIKWVNEILRSVIHILGKDARLYVISVLGIQNSGKSTLLNSLFAVRFAVSAGRCTRGAFLQLLPVAESLRDEMKCDYIAIVDTEGLRSHEKREDTKATNQDNALATFVLYISDLTLINIGGQTMGEDMTNILQIAAHAFIRMKEVNLNSECRIIQQFVANVNAEENNEAAMQSIVSTLDEAVRTAAMKEGKSHLYKKISDVFVVQNYEKQADNIQYIPSLWRGFMAAPNYQYGDSVQRLKSNILESIRRTENSASISDFFLRISDVWNAIRREDFVFSFQNTKEATLYENVMSVYRNLIIPIRSEFIGMQITARQNIENVKVGETSIALRESMQEIEQFLSEKCGSVLKMIVRLLKNKKYQCVQKHEIFFKSDLQTIRRRMLTNAR